MLAGSIALAEGILSMSFAPIGRVAAAIVLGLASLHVGAQETATLKIELAGLAGAEGNVYVSIYDSKDTWLGEDVVITQKVVIAEALDGELVKTQLELAPGEYAVSIFYDENGNGELDANFIGIPREPVALSNNAKPSFGPPKYKDAVFTLGAEGVLQQIQMEEI